VWLTPEAQQVQLFGCPCSFTSVSPVPQIHENSRRCLFDPDVSSLVSKHSLIVGKGGPKMTAKVWCIVFMAALLVIIGAESVKAQSESKDRLVKYYENCITKKISNCNAKTILRTSRSVNLQRKADLSTRQVRFLTTNKNMLIDEMIEQGIDPKPYKVEYYLNKRFYELNR
jgi:hypothetical protein